jgi:hypothetical protein
MVARQESQLLWLKDGDTPTKVFHAHANGRQHKNRIQSLTQDSRTLLSEDKDDAMYNFFDAIIGTPTTRTNAIDLDVLELPRLVLAGLSA